MLGAAASAYYINDAATILPRNIMAKARVYLSGVYVDLLEVWWSCFWPITETKGIQFIQNKLSFVFMYDKHLKKKKKTKFFLQLLLYLQLQLQSLF